MGLLHTITDYNLTAEEYIEIQTKNSLEFTCPKCSAKIKYLNKRMYDVFNIREDFIVEDTINITYHCPVCDNVVADNYKEAVNVSTNSGKYINILIKHLIKRFIDEIKRSFPITNVWMVENAEGFDIFHDRKDSDANNKLFFIAMGQLHFNLFTRKGFKNVSFKYNDPNNKSTNSVEKLDIVDILKPVLNIKAK